MLGTVRENRIHIRNLDFGLILVVLALSVIGVLMVHSATVNEKMKTYATGAKTIKATVFGGPASVTDATCKYILGIN